MGQRESRLAYNASSTSIPRYCSSDEGNSLTTTTRWICLEAHELTDLGRPSYRGFDVVRRACGKLSKKQRRRGLRHRIYLEAFAGAKKDDTRPGTSACSIAFDAREREHVNFAGQRLVVKVEDGTRCCSGGGSISPRLSPRNFGNSSHTASIVTLQLRKERVGTRGDALVGSATLDLAQLDFNGTSQEIMVPLMRREVERGCLRLSVSAQPSPLAQSVLSQPSRHKLVDVAKALSEFLSSSSGLEIVESAWRSSLCRGGGGGGTTDDSKSIKSNDSASSRATFQAMLKGLRAQAALLPEEASDAEVLEQFGRLASGVRQYMASQVESGSFKVPPECECNSSTSNSQNNSCGPSQQSTQLPSCGSLPRLEKCETSETNSSVHTTDSPAPIGPSSGKPMAEVRSADMAAGPASATIDELQVKVEVEVAADTSTDLAAATAAATAAAAAAVEEATAATKEEHDDSRLNSNTNNKTNTNINGRNTTLDSSLAARFTIEPLETNEPGSSSTCPSSRSTFSHSHNPNDLISKLCAEWLRGVVRQCLEASGADHKDYESPLTEDRLRRFLQSGYDFPNLQDIVPVDSNGEPPVNWQGWLESSIPTSCALSKGSQGQVWRAIDRTKGGFFAVKTAEERHGGVLAVDRREREIIDHVILAPHPCLIRLFGAFYEEGLTIVLMEFCSQGDLQRVIRRYHTGSHYALPSRAKVWFGQIFLGLEQLHKKLGVLMRDLKPKNVVVSNDNIAKLTDYGHSRLGLYSTGGFTLHSAPPGTPEYAAPEVVLRKPYGCAADLYSLGVLLWVLLTGGLRASPGNPPTVRPRISRSMDYSFLAQNPGNLRKHILDPDMYGARPLPNPESADLVLRLISDRMTKRPDHEAIRAHALMRPLKLPPFEAPTRVVESWCRRGSQSHDERRKLKN